MMSATVASVFVWPRFSPWAMNEGSEWTTHVPVGGAAAAVAVTRAEAVPTSKNKLLARTTSPNPRLRLFMTPSKEAVIELNPLLQENLEPQFIPPWMVRRGPSDAERHPPVGN